MTGFDYEAEMGFRSHAPGHWAGTAEIEWNSAKWQLKNRVQRLAEMEARLELGEEERAGILLTGTKLA